MSSRRFSTYFGEPLSNESKKIIGNVREHITQPIHPKFDKDFNLYRFILNAERMHKSHADIVESASKALNQHLKVRRCLNLDELPDISFFENRLFAEKFLPCGQIFNAIDACNRLLWFIEYKTISVERIAHGMRTSESILWQFRQFEHMLRRVNEQEDKTGKLSSLRHIIDMNGYEINPFTMLFVSSGTLSYYSQLFHYDNYPELVNPIELVNIAKWIQMPYRLIRTMMPAGFTDRFRLHDGNFLQHLTSEINMEDIPLTLGGSNKEIVCVPADNNKDKQWTASDVEIVKSLESFHVPPRKLRYYRIVIEKQNQILSWYYRTDGDLYFGVFYEPISKGTATEGYEGHAIKKSHNQNIDFQDMDAKETVLPWFKLSAKLVDESDALICASTGIYYIAFSNKQCWLHSRSISATVTVTNNDDDSSLAKHWRYRQNSGLREELTNQYQALNIASKSSRRWRSMNK